MRLLVLGGTVFVGRHIVAAALARGHAVAMFNRGREGDGAFPEVERLVGDRAGDLAALRGRRWDGVIDVAAYVPSFVEKAAGALAFGDRLLVVRPGLIGGPHDPTDRFTYWVRRIARGGDILAPGRPGRTVRFIDARDLAAWIIASIERRLTGTFNAGGGTTMQLMLDACRDVSRSDARLHWADESFLLARGVAPWNELPLWIPEDKNAWVEVADDRATREGLIYSALETTIADTLAWDRTRASGPMKTGLTDAREAELLADLAAHRAS